MTVTGILASCAAAVPECDDTARFGPIGWPSVLAAIAVLAVIALAVVVLVKRAGRRD
ncbi:MAG: hypothetical protein JWQ43_3795 [Glaciihabitans sp.]|nr:hypothetical protein [Glaciihabitans sp.]